MCFFKKIESKIFKSIRNFKIHKQIIGKSQNVNFILRDRNFIIQIVALVNLRLN